MIDVTQLLFCVASQQLCISSHPGCSISMDIKKFVILGTSLVVQLLRLHASSAGGMGSIPVWETKILLATWHSQKKKIVILLHVKYHLIPCFNPSRHFIYFYYYLLLLFIYFWPHHMAYGILEPAAPKVEARSPNPCTSGKSAPRHFKWLQSILQ